MAIDKLPDGGGYALVCDVCWEVPYSSDDFNDVVDHKKENGWKSRKADGEWIDVCPDCQD